MGRGQISASGAGPPRVIFWCVAIAWNAPMLHGNIAPPMPAKRALAALDQPAPPVIGPPSGYHVGPGRRVIRRSVVSEQPLLPIRPLSPLPGAATVARAVGDDREAPAGGELRLVSPPHPGRHGRRAGPSRDRRYSVAPAVGGPGLFLTYMPALQIGYFLATRSRTIIS
jgi:hypothetical protein